MFDESRVREIVKKELGGLSSQVKAMPDEAKIREIIKGEVNASIYSSYGVGPENAEKFSEIHRYRARLFELLGETRPVLSSANKALDKQLLHAESLLNLEKDAIRRHSLSSEKELDKVVCSIKIQHQESLSARNSIPKLLMELKKQIDKFSNEVSSIKRQCAELQTIAPSLHAQYSQKDSDLDYELSRFNSWYDAALRKKNEFDRIYDECESQIKKFKPLSAEHKDVAHDFKKDSSAESSYQTGYKYYILGDFHNAFRHLSSAGEAGYPPAYLRLAIMYRGLCGVAKDIEAAKRWSKKVEAEWQWFESRAKGGDSEAQNYMGACYAFGVGISESPAEAYRWYRLSADQKNIYGQINLARCYLDGRGVEKDEKEAARLYRLAADQGSAVAQNVLGWMYERGLGVAKDEKEAVTWYLLAAEKGCINACTNVGQCYDHGKGVTEDPAQAAIWYQKAAYQGEPNAQYYLGYCYYYFRGLTSSYSNSASMWFEQAANQGLKEAEYRMGELYSNGTGGLTKDLQKALKWYQRAAAQGHEEARKQVLKVQADLPRPVITPISFNRSSFQNEHQRHLGRLGHSQSSTPTSACILQ